LSACAATPPTPARPPGPRAPGTLEIRLHFGQGVDLDLFVVDPRQEAVYFGNNPSSRGARLERDVRCGAAAPRIEVVRFADPLAGRYRVGVSYDRACSFRRRPASFRVEVEADGLALQRAGKIEPGAFENLVLEFSLDALAPTGSPRGARAP